ncbi:MAG: MBL fold metallo-hydrolase [Actinomycetota bacterium]
MPLGPTWTIGDVRITSVIEVDQHWKWAWLLPDVEPDDVDAMPWLRPHFVDEKGKLILRIQALVVESHDQRILVDTCVGNDKERTTPLFDRLSTTFLDDLTAAGFPPESIDQVVCTHLHVDHVGWNTRLVDGDWVPTFPNALYLFGRAEYEYWATAEDAAAYGDVMGDSVAPVVDAGLALMVDSDHLLTPEVQLEPTPGHTPGHVSVRISSVGSTAVITGDMLHHPIQIARPSLCSSADVDAPCAAATRRAAFRRWADSDALVIGSHFAGPGAGRLRPIADPDGADGGHGWDFIID